MTLESNFHELYKARSFSLAYEAEEAIAIAFDDDPSVPSDELIPAGEYLVTASAACWITEGEEPEAEVATAGNFYLPANVPMMLQFNGATKIAVIGHAAATSGVLSLVKRD